MLLNLFSSVNILPRCSAGHAPLWVAQVFLFSHSSYSQHHKQLYHLYHYHQQSCHLLHHSKLQSVAQIVVFLKFSNFCSVLINHHHIKSSSNHHQILMMMIRLKPATTTLTKQNISKSKSKLKPATTTGEYQQFFSQTWSPCSLGLPCLLSADISHFAF